MKTIPTKVLCHVKFIKIWKYRSYMFGKFIGWSQIENIWKCRDCGTWSSDKYSFSFVCPKRDRRKIAERRK